MYLSSVSSRLLLFGTNSWDLKKCYGCYNGLLRDVSWSEDGKYILQVNSKGIVELLSAADRNIRSLQHIPVKDSWSATFHREGHQHVAIGTKNGNVMTWDTKNKCITKTFPLPSQQCCVNFVSYNAENTSLAATMQNGDTVIYGLTSNIPVQTVTVPYSSSISSMKFHHDARSILGLATDDGHVMLQDILMNKEKGLFENSHHSPVSDIAFSLINRDVMFSCGYDKITNVYDVRVQNIVSTLRTQYVLSSLAINVENQVTLGTKTGLILVYDLRNLTTIFKMLRGHEQEVTKVAFQPQRKRIQALEATKPTTTTTNSHQEDAETYLSPEKGCSPTRNRNSDLFYISDSPFTISLNDPPENSKAEDSFLVMMGLDNSNNEINECKETSDVERTSDCQELRYRLSATEKDIGKISTPVTNKTIENIPIQSPLVLNGMPDDGRLSNSKNLPKPSSNRNDISSINAKVLEDLDFVKLTVVDVADDIRKNFLHIMMELTKQKLCIDKKLSAMSKKIDEIQQQQLAIREENRRLALQMGQFKLKHTLL